MAPRGPGKSSLGPAFYEICHGFQRKFVTLRTQSANDARRRQGHKGMLAEFVAAEDIGQVHFNNRQFGGLQRVEDGDRGVCIGARIHDDALRLGPGLLNLAHQLAFKV